MFIPLDDLNEAVITASDDRPEDGIYQARVLQARIGHSKSGNRQVRWDLEFMNPETMDSYRCQKYHSLEVPWINYLLRDLQKFRMTIDHINDLPQVLMELREAVIRIEYQKDGDWYTIRFISLIAILGNKREKERDFVTVHPAVVNRDGFGSPSR